jgi:hypothetical protein
MGVAVGMTVLVGETAWVGVGEAGGIGVADGKGVDEAGGMGVAACPHPARKIRTKKRPSRLLIFLFLLFDKRGEGNTNKMEPRAPSL